MGGNVFKIDDKTPRCVAVIPDGNRRWAKCMKEILSHGHEVGYERFSDVATWARDAGVETLVFFAFSTENWKRNKLEIKCLMTLFSKGLSELFKRAQKEHIYVQFVGDFSHLSDGICKKMDKIEKETCENDAFRIVVAISYGGREEILAAINKILSMRERVPDTLDWNDFSEYLWTADIPEIDLLIRTGAQRRISNFMLAKIAYSELYFTDTLWPDFTQDEFINAIRWFGAQEKRCGV